MNLKAVFQTHQWRFLWMGLLLLIEAGLMILFPLFIGYAIDDALINEYGGALLLGVLGLLTLGVGAARRIWDSRFYAILYQEMGLKIVGRTTHSTSTKSAHLGFLTEVVEFLENTLPEIISNAIGLIGTVVIIALIEPKLFLGCLIMLVICGLVYGISQKRTLLLNGSNNDEKEKQVSVLDKNEPIQVRWHLRSMMRWNIKLSDLETFNFSVVWFFMMGFLVFSLIFSVQNGMTNYGTVFALVLYLFQFIENATIMPIYYQYWLRLSEILGRLKRLDKEDDPGVESSSQFVSSI